MQRRTFLQRLAWSGALIAGGGLPLRAMADVREGTRLTILHTNDWHSQIEPFPADAGRNANRGGASRRASLIRQIRRQEEHVLLLDAGDLFQGTPYFNFFLGEPEMKLMSAMGYDASAIGNHDFDGGIRNLADKIDQHANFPFLCANYDFSGTPMEGRARPHLVVKKGPVRIGIFGLGIQLDGLVPETLTGGTRYLDPVVVANRQAELLREEEKCDLVICLSHLGFRYRNNTVSDVVLAGKSRAIDIIIGGHTHSFLRQPEVVNNLDGEPVIINQVGFGGLVLGRLDLVFERGRVRRDFGADAIAIDQENRG